MEDEDEDKDENEEDEDDDYIIETHTNSNGSLIPTTTIVDHSIRHIERTRGKRKRPQVERIVPKRRKNN